MQTSDQFKLISENIKSITKIDRTTFDVIQSTYVACLGGVLQDFDPSGAKFVFPDQIWNTCPENILAAGIRPRPIPPAIGIAAGPPPAIYAGPGPITKAIMDASAYEHMVYNAAVIRENNSNAKLIQYNAVLSFAKTAILNNALNINPTAYAIMILNPVTGLSDNTIDLSQIFENLINYYSNADIESIASWKSTFNTPRTSTKPIMEFLSEWNLARTRLERKGRVCPYHDLLDPSTTYFHLHHLAPTTYLSPTI
jgi:hypothetical protein